MSVNPNKGSLKAAISTQELSTLFTATIDAAGGVAERVKGAAWVAVNKMEAKYFTLSNIAHAVKTTGRNIQSIECDNGRLFIPSHTKRTTKGFRQTSKSPDQDFSLSDRCPVHASPELAIKLLTIAIKNQQLSYTETSSAGMKTVVAVPKGDEAMLLFHKKIFDGYKDEGQGMHHLHIMASDINNPKAANPIWVDKNGEVLEQEPENKKILLNEGNPVCVTFPDPKTGSFLAVTCGFTYPGGDKKQEKTALVLWAAMHTEDCIEEHAGGALSASVKLLGRSARLKIEKAESSFVTQLKSGSDVLLEDKRTGKANNIKLEGNNILVDGKDLGFRFLDAEKIDMDLDSNKIIASDAEIELEEDNVYVLADGRTIRAMRMRPDQPLYLIEESSIFSNLTSDSTASGGGKSEMIAGLEQIQEKVELSAEERAEIKNIVPGLMESYTVFFQSCDLEGLGAVLKTEGRKTLHAHAVRAIWEYKKQAGFNATMNGLIEFLDSDYELTITRCIISEKEHIYLEPNPAYVQPVRLGIQDDISIYRAEVGEDGKTRLYATNCESQLFQRLDEAILVLPDEFNSEEVLVSPDSLNQCDDIMRTHLEDFKKKQDFANINLEHVKRFIRQDFPDESEENYFVNYYPLTQEHLKLLLANDKLKEQLYSDPEIQKYLEDALSEAKKDSRFILPFVASSNNVRYLQLAPELEKPAEYVLANLKGAIADHRSQALDANVAGLRVEKHPEKDFSMAVFGMAHFMPMHIWSQMALAVPSGKNPSTTDALSNEGPRTLGPFNVLGTDMLMNPWLPARVFSGIPDFLVPSGEIGSTPTGHAAKYMFTTVWNYLSEQEKDPQYLIDNGYLEPTPTKITDSNGKEVEVPEAAMLGYRITEEFVRKFFTRVFSDAEAVLLADKNKHLLKPELQNPEEWVKGVKALDNYRTNAFREIRDSKSFDDLLFAFQVAVELQLSEHKAFVMDGVLYSLNPDEKEGYENFQKLFTPEALAKDPKYRLMLKLKVYVDYANALEAYVKEEDPEEKEKLKTKLLEAGQKISSECIESKIGLPGMSASASTQAIRKIISLMQGDAIMGDFEIREAFYGFIFADASFSAQEGFRRSI